MDSRNPTVGFASRDEAAILYNTARLFHGKPCLEIGCWRGWSTVHLALGSGALDVIDPVLADRVFASDVQAACARAGVLDAITFNAGYSPAAVDDLAHRAAKRWSLIFIDGDHDGAAPMRDAEAVTRHAADDAIVLFHDLVSPDVAAGLGYFKKQGWRTRIYQTMQIMGVAWRGSVSPVDHEPDPSVEWTLPPHLAGYEVSGLPVTQRTRLASPSAPNVRSGPSQRELDLQRELDEALARTVAAEQDFAMLAGRIPDLSDVARLSSLLEVASGERARLLERELDLQRERDEALARATAAERDFAMLAGRIPSVSEGTQLSLLLSSQLSVARGRLEQLEQEPAVAARLRLKLQDAQGLAERLATQRDAACQRAAVAEANLIQLVGRLPEISLALAQARAAESVCEELRAVLADAVDTITRMGETHQLRQSAIRALAEWIIRRRILLGLLRRPERLRISLARQRAEVLGVFGLVTPTIGHRLCRRRMLVGLLRRSKASRIGIVANILLDADRGAFAEALTWLEERRHAASRTIQPGHYPDPLPAIASATKSDQLTRENQILQRRFQALEQAKALDEATLLEARIELATLRATRRREP